MSAQKAINPLDAAPLDPQAVITAANRELAQADKRKIIENQVDLKKEKQVLVTMSPQYQSYFGEVMTVGLNGINIYFPVDGRSYKVPYSYAMIIQQRRRMVDDQLMRRSKLADVTRNREDYAGGLELIPR